jgi:hypothetical protein
MKILRKLRQRLTGIVAHDVDRKPLRVGDEVMIVSNGKIRDGLRGLTCSIIGLTPNYMLVLDLPHPAPPKVWVADGDDLRRIDTPDSASWEQVTESTGWKPSREKVREAVEQVMSEGQEG